MKSTAPTATEPAHTASTQTSTQTNTQPSTQEVYETIPGPSSNPTLQWGQQVGQQLSQHAPQLATRAGRVAKTAALWLGLWLLVAITGLILLIMTLLGYAYAGPLLLLLLVGCGVLLWQQLRGLRGVAATVTAPFSDPDSTLDERTRRLIHDLHRLTRSSRVGPVQDKLDYTANLITEALRATAAQGGLMTRDTHDARMAAERDLPQALRAFTSASNAGASVRYAEVLLAEQLQAVQERMLEILQQHSSERLRDLEAQRHFVQENYKSAPRH